MNLPVGVQRGVERCRLVLSTGWRRAAGFHRGIRVGFFGKHPGWKDYVDGHLPLEGKLIARFKHALEQSVRRQLVDSSTDGRVPFDHTIYLRRGRSHVIARVWESHDQQNHRRFPMVACMELMGWSTAGAMEFALPRLNEAVALFQREDKPEPISAYCFARARSWRRLCVRRFRSLNRTTAGQDLVSNSDSENAGESADRLPASRWGRAMQIPQERKHRLPTIPWATVPALAHLRLPLDASATNCVADYLGKVRQIAGPLSTAMVVVPGTGGWLDLAAGGHRWMHLALDAMTYDMKALSLSDEGIASAERMRELSESKLMSTAPPVASPQSPVTDEDEVGTFAH